MADRRRISFLVVPLVLVGLVGLLWLRGQANDARRLASPVRARREHRPMPVRTALVTLRQVTTVVGATALAVPSKQLPILLGSSHRFNELNPVVHAVSVRNGDYVIAGQPLIELEPDLFQRAVSAKFQALQAARAVVATADARRVENAKTRRVELDSAAAELEFREADVVFRKDDHERLERLHTAGQANLTEYLEAAAAYAKARFDLTQAVLRDRLAKADMVVGPAVDREAVEQGARAEKEAVLALALAEGDVVRLRLTSPFAGYVDNLAVVVGQRLQASTVLAEVLAVDPIHVAVEFPQERIDVLELGQPAEVVFDSFPRQTFQGKVVRVAARVDPQRRVLSVLVEVPNGDRRIKIGVSAYVRIEVPREAVTVPASGTTRLDTRAAVFVVEDGRAHRRSFKAGALIDVGLVEVIEGLKPGDEIVIHGQQYLEDGDAVDTDWRRWARRD